MSKIHSLLLAGALTLSMSAAATTPLAVSMGNPSVSEDFNSMWDPASSEATMTLPEGWRIDRNLDAPRKVGAWSDASSEVMYTGGVSLASNAKNGTWSFGDSSDTSDRAIGGLTTTVANGTRGLSLMTSIVNEADMYVDRLQISYDIEKYRYGANAAGFAVQLYYSHDGENWRSAGNSFRTDFAPDPETIGAEVVPVSTTGVDGKWLTAEIAPGETLWLAWNISVASGSTPDKAQGLAIDDIVITASFSENGSEPDPDRKPFVASGIYLRGEVNSWGAEADWEFSAEGDNTYVLYDKTLSGQFKVADANWSSSCNYGSNGSNIIVDTPYQMTAGTDSNISCGSYVFACKRIVLTIVDGVATILLEADDDDTDLTAVYVYGDFNSWNFMSTDGMLTLDETDALFKGQISMKAGADGLAHWRIYQRPGMGGAWGLSEDATETTTAGVLVKGATGTAAVAPGTYAFTFSLSDGAYTLTPVESAPALMTLDPAYTILTPENPETIKVLSLNNSLIHYNDQDFVFNDIARAMGTDASWTKHTNLGKPLSYHWEEGDGLAADGTPGAKMMIRSDAWSHIILQEQSSLPRTSPETFRNNVAQWMDYIRQYCPNPNATVIIPVNWAYSSDLDNFSAYNARFLEVYSDVAAALGAVVVPVAVAYDNAFRTEGNAELSTWFSDDRHPTLKATYMAACMEYGAITGSDPAAITWAPAGLSSDVAAKMRTYAAEALASYTNTVSPLEGKIRFSTRIYDDFGIEFPAEETVYTVDGGGVISPEGVFTSDGTRGEFTVTATCGDFTKTAVIKVADHLTDVPSYPAISLNADTLKASEDFDSLGLEAAALLPEAWRIDRQTVATRTLGTYATALTETMYVGGTSLPSNAKNGLWNFGADGDTDRAPGGITTGVADGTRAVNLYTHIANDGRKPLDKVTVSYDVEKYRKGNNAAGFAVQLYYSYDGRNWQNAGSDFYTYLAPDAATEGYAVVPGETIPVTGTLPVSLGAGLDIYLAWNISVASGDAAQGAMALAIDNVRFEGALPEVPVTKHRIYVDNQTSWDALGLYAWGDAEIFGAWPGQAPIDEVTEEGVVFTVFGLDTESGSYNLIFNNWNNNKQLPDFAITGDRDYWLRIDDNGVTERASVAVDQMTAPASALRFEGRTLRTTDGTAITLFTADGRRAAEGRGPVMDLTGLAPGLYVAVAGTDTCKIAIR